MSEGLGFPSPDLHETYPQESEAASPLRGGSVLAESWGWVGLVASERGLRLLILPCESSAACLEAIEQQYPGVPLLPEDPPLAEAAQQVCAYLSGQLREFNLSLDLRGHTSFALSVWAAAGRIGYGQTRSYQWVARHVGGGKGIYQAVGTALGSNPVPLVIPCHRVIGSDGSLHGYAGGLAMKARLLAMESGQATLL